MSSQTPSAKARSKRDIRQLNHFASCVIAIALLLPIPFVSNAYTVNGSTSTTINLTTSNGAKICPKSPLGGTWYSKTKTCIISGSNSIPAGTTLEIGDGVTLEAPNMTNAGKILNSGTLQGGKLYSGNFLNEATGLMNGGLNQIIVNGLLTNEGLIVVTGALVVVARAILNNTNGIIQNEGGALTVNGTFSNSGNYESLASIGMSTDVIYNFGSIENAGNFSVTGTLNIYDDGIFSNNDSLVFQSGYLDSNGTVTNNEEGLVNFTLGGFTNYNEGSFANTGELIFGEGVAYNDGTLTNNEDGLVILNYTFYNTPKSIFDNNGTLKITENGFLWNQGSGGAGDSIVRNSAYLFNFGQITNGYSNQDAEFYNTGAINNSGLFTNVWNFWDSGGFYNYGTFDVAAGNYTFDGTIFSNAISEASVNVGSQGTAIFWVKNVTGTFTNAGSFTVYAGSIFEMSRGVFTNAGEDAQFVNHGTTELGADTLVDNSGLFSNSGSVLEEGNFSNTNGIVENYGTLQIGPSANVQTLSQFINEGFATISNDGIFVDGYNVTNSGTFVNQNQLEIGSGAFFDILNEGILNSTGSVVNNGNFTNGYGGSLLVSKGKFSNNYFVELKSGSYTEVDQEFFNGELLFPSYNFVIDSGATLIIGGGLLVNAGSVSSAGGIQLDSTGSISNYGTLNNTGDIDNAGSITDICNGTLIGSGSINVSPVSQVCSTPAIKYPTSGQVTYSGTLTINGTSNPLATITIFSGKKSIGVVTANSTGFWSFTTSKLAPGNYTLTAVASGVDGNSAHSKVVKIDLVL